MLYLCNDRDQWYGNMGKGECCSGFGERVCQFITGKSSMTGEAVTHWKLSATREERESRRETKYSRRTLVGETPESLEKRGRGTIECGMSSDGSDTIPAHVPVQVIHLKS